MKKKAKLLILFNVLFYVFIFIHKYYTYDDVPQLLFYMALLFSSVFLEETFRSKTKKLKVYSLVDFLIRIGVVILHFTSLILEINISKVNLATIIFFIFNIILELIILDKVKTVSENKSEFVNQKDINKFIEDFKSRKLNFYTIGKDLKDETELMIKTLEISGKSNIVIINLFILIFISRFVYIHFSQLIFMSILLIILLICILFKLSLHTNIIVYNNNERKGIRNYIDIVTFIIGYIIIFGTEVMFYEKIGCFHITILVVGVIFFIPIFNTKYIVKKKFEKLYKNIKRLFLVNMDV